MFLRVSVDASFVIHNGRLIAIHRCFFVTEGGFKHTWPVISGEKKSIFAILSWLKTLKLGAQMDMTFFQLFP